MTQNPAPSAPKRRPTLGAIAIIAGILGLLVSIAGIGGAVVGRSWAGDRLDQLAEAAKSGLDTAVNISDQALTALQDGVAQASELQTNAEALAANPALDEAGVAALQEKLAPLAEKYASVRDRYVVFREKATSVLDTINRLGRLIPGLDLPEGPTKLVQGMDEKLQSLDQAISDIQSRAATRTGAQETANVVAVSAGRLTDGLTKASDAAQQIQQRLIEMQDKVDKAADRLNLYVTAGAGVLALFCLWIAILNLALIALGRRWRA
jgi:hypothetical protein